jgi:hypothetical protein
MITLGTQLVPQFNISADVREITEATLRVLNRWFEPGAHHLRTLNHCSIDVHTNIIEFNKKQLTNAILTKTVGQILQRGGVRVKLRAHKTVRKRRYGRNSK